jgi:hypothetical protein
MLFLPDETVKTAGRWNRRPLLFIRRFVCRRGLNPVEGLLQVGFDVVDIFDTDGYAE